MGDRRFQSFDRRDRRKTNEMAEALLKGSAHGTKWNFAYSGGSFEVHFASNGEFFCPSYKAHSYWTVEGDKVAIDWKKYGTYDMVMDVGAKTMSGHYRGYPDDWRKATYLGELDHAHSHADHDMDAHVH